MSLKNNKTRIGNEMVNIAGKGQVKINWEGPPSNLFDASLAVDIPILAKHKNTIKFDSS